MRRALLVARALLLVVLVVLLAGLVQVVAPLPPADAADCYPKGISIPGVDPACQLQVGENGQLQDSQATDLAGTLIGQVNQTVQLGAEWVNAANFGVPPSCINASLRLVLQPGQQQTVFQREHSLVVCGYWMALNTGYPTGSGQQYNGTFAVTDWVDAYDNGGRYNAWLQPFSGPTSPLGQSASWACISGATPCPTARLVAVNTNGITQICEQANIGGSPQNTWCSTNGVYMVGGRVLPSSDFGHYDAFRNPAWKEPYINQPRASPQRLVLQTDGNLVLYSASGKPLWSSGGGWSGSCMGGGLFCIPVNNGVGSTTPPSPSPCSAGSGQAVVQNPGLCQIILWMWQSGSGAKRCYNSAQPYFALTSPSAPVYSTPAGCHVRQGAVLNSADQPQAVNINVTLPGVGQQFFAAAVVYDWSMAGSHTGAGAGYEFPLTFWSSGLITMVQPPPPPSPINTGQADFGCTTPNNPTPVSSCTEQFIVPVTSSGQVIGAPYLNPHTVVSVSGTATFPNQTQDFVGPGGESYQAADITADGAAPECSFFGVDCSVAISLLPGYEPPDWPLTWSILVYAGETVNATVLVSGPSSCIEGDISFSKLMGGSTATASGTFYALCGGPGNQPALYAAKLLINGQAVATVYSEANTADVMDLEQAGTAINQQYSEPQGFPYGGYQYPSGTSPTVCADYLGTTCGFQVVWPQDQLPNPGSYLYGPETFDTLELEGFPVAVDLHAQSPDYFITGQPASPTVLDPAGNFGVTTSSVTIYFEFVPQVQVPTKTTVQLSPNPVWPGQEVTLSARVQVKSSGTGVPADSGQVEFIWGNGQDCVAGQVGAGGTASCQARLISEGSPGQFPALQVTAKFMPNPGSQYGTSSNSATESFQQPTLSLSALPSSTYFGDQVQLQAITNDPFATSCSVLLLASPQYAADAAHSSWPNGLYIIHSPNGSGVWQTSYGLASPPPPGVRQDQVQFSGQLECAGLGTLAQGQTSATWVQPPPQPGVPT